MVESTISSEELKNQGNDALKAKDALKAVSLYTASLDIEKSEGVYTNRAVAFIKLAKYKEALYDCEQALVLNPTFAKAHVRSFTCYTQIGELQKALIALQTAEKLGDETAAKSKMWTLELIKYEDFAGKALQKLELNEAKFYFKKILESCVDSVKHTCLLLETLIRESPNDLTDAVSYSTKVQEKFIEQPEFLFWRGRILIYNGQTEVGKKHIKQALSVDPDSKKVQQFWKNLQKAERLKNEAAEAYKTGDIDTAVRLYDECLGFDSLNNSFNVTILYNSGCALAKVGRNDDALTVLNKAINMNKEYVKVYMKRGDIFLSLEKYQEAVQEFTKVKELAPQTQGIREKLKHAQIELKKSKRKDYYKILELSKDAGESEIKKAYRLMAVKWHPDKHQQAGEEAMQEAERKFKDVGEAYSVLSDPQKKQQYDQGMDLEEINQGGRSGGMGGMDPNDIFQMFFQGGGGRGGGHHGHSFHF